jgi:ESCRT-I complex subunit TSG101
VDTWHTDTPLLTLVAHDNGRMQLLLSLIGTIPIVYQSATYNIPVAYWLPLSYPTVAPIVFVTPTALMLVKAGKYVDVSGRCYHPQLAFWNSDVSTPQHMLIACAMYHVYCKMAQSSWTLTQ